MDPVTMMTISMAATAAGAGISAFGQYQGGQASKAMYNYQAGVGRALGGAEMKAANVTEYAGGRAAEDVGLRYGGQIAQGAVGYGAGQIGGRTVSDVRASQTALGVQSQRETLGKYRETAYGERLRGAEEFAGAGLHGMAAAEAPIAGDIGAIGSIVSGAGSVAGKWYEAAKYTPSSAPYTGASDQAIY